MPQIQDPRIDYVSVLAQSCSENAGTAQAVTAVMMGVLRALAAVPGVAESVQREIAVVRRCLATTSNNPVVDAQFESTIELAQLALGLPAELAVRPAPTAH